MAQRWAELQDSKEVAVKPQQSQIEEVVPWICWIKTPNKLWIPLKQFYSQSILLFKCQIIVGLSSNFVCTNVLLLILIVVSQSGALSIRAIWKGNFQKWGSCVRSWAVPLVSSVALGERPRICSFSGTLLLESLSGILCSGIKNTGSIAFIKT